MLNEKQIRFLLNGHNHDGRNSKYIFPTSGYEPQAVGTTVANGPQDGTSVTIVVAAANSFPNSKASANFVCTNTSAGGPGFNNGDDVTISQAIAALPSYGGDILLLEGDYYWSNPDYTVWPINEPNSIIVPSNITLRGCAGATKIHLPNDTQPSVCFQMDNLSRLKDMAIIIQGGVFFDTPFTIAATGNGVSTNLPIQISGIFFSGDNYVRSNIGPTIGHIAPFTGPAPTGAGIFQAGFLNIRNCFLNMATQNVAIAGPSGFSSSYITSMTNCSLINCGITELTNKSIISSNIFRGEASVFSNKFNMSINNNIFYNFGDRTESLFIAGGNNNITNNLVTVTDGTTKFFDSAGIENIVSKNRFDGSILEIISGISSFTNQLVTYNWSNTHININSNNNIVVFNRVVGGSLFITGGVGNQLNLDGSGNNWNVYP